MKNSSNPEPHLKKRRPNFARSARVFFGLVMLALVLLAPTLLNSHAQNESPLYVASVSTRPQGTGTVVTVAADGSLSRAQTWQDREGFHVVIPEAVASSQIKSGRGIKLRRIGSSVEILLQTKPGARVAVQGADSRLNISIEGKLEAQESDTAEPSDNEQAIREYRRALDAPVTYATPEPAYPTYTPSQNSDAARSSQGYPAGTAAETYPHAESAPPQGAIRQAGEYSNPIQGNAPEISEEEEGFLASVLSATGVLIVLVVGAFGYLAFRVSRSQLFANLKSRASAPADELSAEAFEEGVEMNAAEVTSLVPTNRSLPETGHRERKAAVRPPQVVAPASVFGAFRVDQEVSKLVTGQAHRMDVMSSRAPDDLRAIEASLIKTVLMQNSSDEERRRARSALEEYGFVARQCATLLLAPEAFDRTSAARSLGEMGSPAALPFLLEALYDFETIVRNQAVVSIGELKVPSAIGALLDMARKHPDVPPSLVSRALSACSVEGLDFFDTVSSPGFLNASVEEHGGLDITHLEPVTSIEQLPETLDEQGLTVALAGIESADVEVRTQAVKDLGLYNSQNSVSALSLVARMDPESSVRATAISSLAGINHESIFPAVLIGMADDSREVRAVSARALSRLDFDRSDAYVRVIETADPSTLGIVAEACVKAGIVSQNLDRLSSNDRRHAYEAFCLICLLAKAGKTQPILDAIKEHPTLKVRLNAIHLLATTGQPEVLDKLRELANDASLPEEVKSAIVEGMYKLEQMKPKVEAVEDFVVQEHESVQEPEFENSAGAGMSSELETTAAPMVSGEFEDSAGQNMSDGFENSAGYELADSFQFNSNLKTEIEVDEVEM